METESVPEHPTKRDRVPWRKRWKTNIMLSRHVTLCLWHLDHPITLKLAQSTPRTELTANGESDWKKPFGSPQYKKRPDLHGLLSFPKKCTSIYKHGGNSCLVYRGLESKKITAEMRACSYKKQK